MSGARRRRAGGRRGLGLAWLAPAVLLVGCEPRAVQVRALELQSDTIPALAGGPRREAALQGGRAAIERAAWLRLCPAPLTPECRNEAWRLLARLELAPGPLPGQTVHVLALQLRPLGEQEPLTIQVEGPGVPALDAAGAARLFEPGLARLAERLAIRRAPTAALCRRLPDASGPERFWLVDELAGRAGAGAAPDELSAALAAVARQERDEATALRALGGLLAARATGLGEVLIEATHRRGPAFVIQVIQILAGVGGPEARGFVATLAAGHPDAQVRAAAQRAGAALEESR